MTKQLILGKNSFTLFETLISIVLLSIVIVGFSQNSYYENFDKEYQFLNKIENNFNTKSYDEKYTSSYENIQITINDSENKNILIKKIRYQDENIDLVKYELK